VQQSDALVKKSIEDLTVFDKWPGQGGEVQRFKVPSKLSYSETHSGQRQWGYSIDKKSTILGWTKLELMPQSPGKELTLLRNLLEGLILLKKFQQSDELDSEMPKHLVKNASEVIRDYLDKVAKEWYGHMTGTGASTLRNIDLDIVVTHPIVRLPQEHLFLRSANSQSRGTTMQ